MRSKDGSGDRTTQSEPAAGEVEARPIADFAPSEPARRVNFLKIDVEGFELHGKLQDYRCDNSYNTINRSLYRGCALILCC